MFVDKAKIFVKGGNGGDGIARSDVSCTYLKEALLAAMAVEVPISFSGLMKGFEP